MMFQAIADARAVFGAILMAAAAAGSVQAQSNQFAPGWTLDPAESYIRFRSVKTEKGKEIIETHSFATFDGGIESDGSAKIVVKLDSVNTNNDLRNVRMRFLFFETFKYPEAQVTASLTPQMADDVARSGQMSVAIPFDFSIHGMTNPMVADVSVTAESNDRVVVRSAQPLVFRVAEFDLTNNLIKIAETAGGFDIFPEMNVTFQFAFDRRSGGEPAPVIAEAESQVELEEPTMASAQAAAIETKGEFSIEECLGRFEVLSETGNIYFASGSAQLDSESRFVLTTVVDIIERCPSLRVQISGHTDSDGSSAYNLGLSQRRAQSVETYLMRQGVDGRRLYTAGFGEDHPMVPNDTAFNKSRNRRIEFSLYR